MVVTLSACGSKGDLYHASEPRADQNDKEKSNKEINEETKKKTQ